MGHAALEFFTNYIVAIPLVLVLIAIISRRRWLWDIADGVIGGALTIVFVKLAGLLHYETRPFAVWHRQPLVAHIADNSFPSDHLAATGLAVTYLWFRSKPMSIAAAAAGVLLGFARVQTLLHWPVDIIAGFALGLCAMLIGHLVTTRLLRGNVRDSSAEPQNEM